MFVINNAAELEAWKVGKKSKGELSLGKLYQKGIQHVIAAVGWRRDS